MNSIYDKETPNDQVLEEPVRSESGHEDPETLLTGVRDKIMRCGLSKRVRSSPTLVLFEFFFFFLSIYTKPTTGPLISEGSSLDSLLNRKLSGVSKLCRPGTSFPETFVSHGNVHP